MPRQRLTRKLAEQKTRKASPPPSMPAVDRTEGPSSPAYYPDPDADKYENGDPSAWAEDPHNPMDPESAPPSMPGNLTTEEPDHPATTEFQRKPGEAADMSDDAGTSKQASLKELAERRATLCVRLASAMMPKASAIEVEERAVALMDFEDSQLKAAMQTFQVIAGDEEEDDDDTMAEEIEEIEVDKMASQNIVANTDRIARLEKAFGRMVKAMEGFFGMDEDEDDDSMSESDLMAYLTAEDDVDQNAPDYGYSEKEAMEHEHEHEAMEHEHEHEHEEHEAMNHMSEDEGAEEEAMLRAMLEEMEGEMSVKEASAAEDATEPLADGDSIQSGEGGNVKPDEYAHTPTVAQADGSEKKATVDPTDMDIDIASGTDPMGLMDVTASKENDDLLAALYADLELPKTAGDEDMEVEMEEAEVEMPEEDDSDEGKTAAKQRPQPKAASRGAKQLGNVSGMPKAAHDEITELGKIWETAPDVMAVFGLPGGK